MTREYTFFNTDSTRICKHCRRQEKTEWPDNVTYMHAQWAEMRKNALPKIKKKITNGADWSVE